METTKEAQIQKLERGLEAHKILRNSLIRGGYTERGFEGPTAEDLAKAEQNTDVIVRIRAEISKLRGV